MEKNSVLFAKNLFPAREDIDGVLRSVQPKRQLEHRLAWRIGMFKKEIREFVRSVDLTARNIAAN